MPREGKPVWDPVEYLAFSEQRSRPFHELVARIGASAPRRVVDLGCGPGNLTRTLAQRWPGAVVNGVDSSPEMVRQARARGVDAALGDLARWSPGADADVVVTNAALQWVSEHPALLRAWLPRLPRGAWFAMQVPGNFAAPSHVLVRELAAEPQWAQLLSGVTFREPGAVLEPAGYAELFAEADCRTDVWETTYLQELRGADPVLEWISGTALRPVRQALDDERWQRFREELAPRLRAAYPARADGTTLFPFRRVFAVAQCPG